MLAKNTHTIFLLPSISQEKQHSRENQKNTSFRFRVNSRETDCERVAELKKKKRKSFRFQEKTVLVRLHASSNKKVKLKFFRDSTKFPLDRQIGSTNRRLIYDDPFVSDRIARAPIILQTRSRIEIGESVVNQASD